MLALVFSVDYMPENCLYKQNNDTKMDLV